MTNAQRNIFVDLFFHTNKTVPARLVLALPVYNENTKKIDMGGKSWLAQVNPNITKPEDILVCYENDFDIGYKKAQECLGTQK